MLVLSIIAAYLLPGLMIYAYGIWVIRPREREVLSFREHVDALLICLIFGPLWIAIEVAEWVQSKRGKPGAGKCPHGEEWDECPVCRD
jgi:hypothetical protein